MTNSQSVEEARKRVLHMVQPHRAHDYTVAEAEERVDALIEAVRGEQDGEAGRALRNLLAVINRDGGHRTAEFATLTEAAADGERIVIETRVELERRVVVDGEHHEVR